MWTRLLPIVVLVAGTVAYASWVVAAPGPWDRATVAAVGGSVGTLVAVAAALWIGYQDRRDLLRQIREDRAHEHQVFVRRRDYEECVRLLELIELDRRKWEDRAGDEDRPRSVEAVALVRALWHRRAWWATVWDWYIGHRQPGNRFDAGQDIPGDVFSEMQREVAEAINQLDWHDRRAVDVR